MECYVPDFDSVNEGESNRLKNVEPWEEEEKKMGKKFLTRRLEKRRHSAKSRGKWKFKMKIEP